LPLALSLKLNRRVPSQDDSPRVFLARGLITIKLWLTAKILRTTVNKKSSLEFVIKIDNPNHPVYRKSKTVSKYWPWSALPTELRGRNEIGPDLIRTNDNPLSLRLTAENLDKQKMTVAS